MACCLFSSFVRPVQHKVIATTLLWEEKMGSSPLSTLVFYFGRYLLPTFVTVCSSGYLWTQTLLLSAWPHNRRSDVHSWLHNCTSSGHSRQAAAAVASFAHKCIYGKTKYPLVRKWPLSQCQVSRSLGGCSAQPAWWLHPWPHRRERTVTDCLQWVLGPFQKATGGQLPNFCMFIKALFVFLSPNLLVTSLWAWTCC